MTFSRRVICFSFCLSCMLSSGITLAQQDWSPVGSSDMRWTFFKLYNITLLTDSGEYQPQAFPQALEILYYRDINKEDLVKATGDQWAKLGISAEKREAWLPELLDIWPDIKAKDRLRVEVDINGNNTFFHNERFIGTVEHTDFSQAFLDIWLSPNTTQPQLRRKLIGGRSENV